MREWVWCARDRKRETGRRAGGRANDGRAGARLIAFSSSLCLRWGGEALRPFEGGKKEAPSSLKNSRSTFLVPLWLQLRVGHSRSPSPSPHPIFALLCIMARRRFCGCVILTTAASTTAGGILPLGTWLSRGCYCFPALFVPCSVLRALMCSGLFWLLFLCLFQHQQSRHTVLFKLHFLLSFGWPY